VEAPGIGLFRYPSKTGASIFHTFLEHRCKSVSVQVTTPSLCCLQGSMGTQRLLPWSTLGRQAASQRLAGGFTPSGLVSRVFSKCIFTGRACKELGDLERRYASELLRAFVNRSQPACAWSVLKHFGRDFVLVTLGRTA